MSERNVTLAIESAVAGGSISIFRGETEIAHWTGTSNVSKAEDLLWNIDILLTKNEVSMGQIDLIAVSAGPGSFTGIRIGIATALGLKAGLGIEMSSESCLWAMKDAFPTEGAVTAALPVGRDAVCVQAFFGTRTLGPTVQCEQSVLAPVGQPYTLTEDAFAALVGENNSDTFIVHERLFEMVQALPNAVNFGLNLAHAVGRICMKNRGVVVEPLFISKSF